MSFQALKNNIFAAMRRAQKAAEGGVPGYSALYNKDRALATLIIERGLGDNAEVNEFREAMSGYNISERDTSAIYNLALPTLVLLDRAGALLGQAQQRARAAAGTGSWLMNITSWTRDMTDPQKTRLRDEIAEVLIRLADDPAIKNAHNQRTIQGGYDPFITTGGDVAAGGGGGGGGGAPMWHGSVDVARAGDYSNITDIRELFEIFNVLESGNIDPRYTQEAAARGQYDYGSMGAGAGPMLAFDALTMDPQVGSQHMYAQDPYGRATAQQRRRFAESGRDWASAPAGTPEHAAALAEMRRRAQQQQAVAAGGGGAGGGRGFLQLPAPAAPPGAMAAAAAAAGVAAPQFDQQRFQHGMDLLKKMGGGKKRKTRRRKRGRKSRRRRNLRKTGRRRNLRKTRCRIHKRRSKRKCRC
jgi:pyruvate/2-oxoglutarate dehydrogenase complex dihydrolipoamide acyltransferase (E2) component